MSGNTGEMGQVQVIVNDAADRRLADRLARAGLPVAQVSQQALSDPVRGAVYVAAGARAATVDVQHLTRAATVDVQHLTRAATVDVQHLTRAGAHLVLLPPFPNQLLTLATDGAVIIAPAGRRDGVRLVRPIVEGIGSSAIPARPLRILYRERIAGGASTSLAESIEGEMLAGAMPRMSNLHGQLIVCSLMLGAASAQTDLADVAIFVRALVGWCAGDEAVAAGEVAMPQQQLRTAVTSEHDAQLVLLALTLALGDAQPDAAGATTVSIITVQPIFERVAALLGETPTEQALSDGWLWLHDHGVLSHVPADAPDSSDGTMSVDQFALRKLVQMWQLQPWLRRLSRMPVR